MISRSRAILLIAMILAGRGARAGAGEGEIAMPTMGVDDDGLDAADAPAGPQHLEASRASNGPIYRLDPAVDIPLLVLGGTLSAAWLLGDELGPANCAPLCDERDVNAFDRFSAGSYDERWALASNITLIGTAAVGVVALFANQRSVCAFSDLVVAVETVLLANSVTVVANLAARRPRPYLYSEAAPLRVRTSGTASLSFPSGHVTTATALTTAVFGALYARHPRSPWTYIFLGFGVAASGVVAAGRILAGRHFLSDVLAGALVGTGMGVLVPSLHERRLALVPTASAGAAGLSLSGSF
jgi:membrane-associated phospholipid phosphatase